MKTKYKTLKEYMQVVNTINHLRNVGIVRVLEQNKFEFIVGGVLFGVGLISIPIPFVTIPLLILSCSLMGLTIQDVYKKKRVLKFLIKYKYQKWRLNK